MNGAYIFGITKGVILPLVGHLNNTHNNAFKICLFDQTATKLDVTKIEQNYFRKLMT